MGELCIHEDKLYECTTAIAAPGEAWNANHWNSVVLADAYKDLKSDIESKQNAPSAAGTAGQVLGLDAQLHPVWVDQTGGTVDDSALAPVIKSSASGEIASFPDGADGRLIDSLVVNIEPKQDLNGYDSPWPAGGGKNLANPQTGYNSSGGSVDTTTIVTDATNEVISSLIKVNGDTQYTISRATPGGLFRCFYFDQEPVIGQTVSIGGNYVGDSVIYRTFTTPSTAKYLFVVWTRDKTNSPCGNVQCELGSSATSWVPYENLCPISGWTGANVTRTGKNLCDPSKRTNTSSTVHHFYLQDGFLIKGGVSYTLSTDSEDAVAVYFRSSDNSTTIKGGHAVETYTPTKDEFVVLQVYKASGVSSVNLQLEIGSTATDYEPYSGQTIQVEFPSEAGTVYGGKLTVNEDGTGQLVVDRASATITSVTSVAEASTGIKYGSTGNYLSPLAKSEASSNRNVSSMYKYRINAPSESGWFRIVSGVYIFIFDNRFTDLQTANAILASEKPQFVYELATPITYDLTAAQVRTLLGQNNIWADTGDVEVTYRADTKLYIDNKLSELVAQIVNS